ncbi:MAG: hypothetical protein IH898_06420, partial [Planctomycetes bacterium]|nr:hypothetical protein [Planctomycetota bacterium]
LEQIEKLDSTSGPSRGDISQEEPAPVAPAAPAAYDPFQEAFGSEEIVLDQYLEFECELLATAPRVINRLDTAFAYQLRDFAIQDVSTDSIGTASSTSTTTDALTSPDFNPLEVAGSDTEIDPEEGVEILAADSPAERDPGDVLVIEEEGRAHVNLVAGRQFRQLFSSLQSQSRIG